jgi:hypothetical protein
LPNQLQHLGKVDSNGRFVRARNQTRSDRIIHLSDGVAQSKALSPRPCWRRRVWATIDTDWAISRRPRSLAGLFAAL